MLGAANDTQMLPMSEHGVKNEMRMYDNGRLFAQTELPTNMINQELMYTPTPYEQQTQETVQSSAYNAKMSRLQYVTSPKIATQQETGYSKYNTGLFITYKIFFMLHILYSYRKKKFGIQSSEPSTQTVLQQINMFDNSKS